MKMTCEQALTYANNLSALLNENNTNTYPAKVIIYATRNIRKLLEETSTYKEIKDNAIIEFGKQKEDGSYEISHNDTKAIQQFMDKIKDFANVEIDVDIKTIPADVFNGMYKVQDIIPFEFMIEY